MLGTWAYFSVVPFIWRIVSFLNRVSMLACWLWNKFSIPQRPILQKRKCVFSIVQVRHILLTSIPGEKNEERWSLLLQFTCKKPVTDNYFFLCKFSHTNPEVLDYYWETLELQVEWQQIFFSLSLRKINHLLCVWNCFCVVAFHNLAIGSLISHHVSHTFFYCVISVIGRIDDFFNF